jgi:hypothetical protein
MNLNVTSTPNQINEYWNQISPQLLATFLFIVTIAIITLVIATYYMYKHQGTTLNIKIYRLSDGQYALKYYWHEFGPPSIRKTFDTQEALTQHIKERIERTWKE